MLAPEKPQTISSIRRSLQQEHLNILLEIILRPTDTPEDGRTIAWYKLCQLQKAIDINLKEFGEKLDIYTIAHLQFSSDRVSAAAKQIASSKY